MLDSKLIRSCQYDSGPADGQMIAFILCNCLNATTSPSATNQQFQPLGGSREVAVKRNTGLDREIPYKARQSVLNSLISASNLDARHKLQNEKPLLLNDRRGLGHQVKLRRPAMQYGKKTDRYPNTLFFKSHNEGLQPE